MQTRGCEDATDDLLLELESVRHDQGNALEVHPVRNVPKESSHFPHIQRVGSTLASNRVREPDTGTRQVRAGWQLRGTLEGEQIAVLLEDTVMSLLTDTLSILRSAECQRVNFRLESIRVYGDGYKTIAKNIETGHIQIVMSSAISSQVAAYDSQYNCLILGRTPKPNLIVHECTHALNDWHKRKIIAVDDEASAHIAQMMYVLLKDRSLNNLIAELNLQHRADFFAQRCGINPQSCNTAAVGAAAVIAGDLLNARKPTFYRLQQLRNAIQRDPKYRATAANRTRAYNGIRRTPIPAALLTKLQGAVISR